MFKTRNPKGTLHYKNERNLDKAYFYGTKPFSFLLFIRFLNILFLVPQNLFFETHVSPTKIFALFQPLFHYKGKKGKGCKLGSEDEEK